jgi:adenosine deaminase
MILRGQTNDIVPFRNNLLGGYALPMAPPPYGLGLANEEVKRIAEMSLQQCRFSVFPDSNR